MTIIASSQYADGTYKRSEPRVVKTIILDLSTSETKAVRKGRRNCSCEAADLTGLGERCMAVARECRALSWSITPMPNTHIGVPKVYVAFHNWPESGMCNFGKPIGKARYWWDVRPIPECMAPDDERAMEDDGKTIFDQEA
jgi:hypothetical protein